MLFIPRLAVAAVAGFALAAPTAAFAETPTPAPSAEATATATATASTTPSVTPSVTPSATPSATGSISPTAAPTPPPPPATLPPLTKFEGPFLTRDGCDVRVEYALDPAVRIETFRSVNGGEFEQQFHPNWYWTDTYKPGDKVTWELRYNGETKGSSITIPNPCDSEPTPTPKATPTPTPPTPTATTRGVVTAKYECGAVTFTNPLDKSVLIHYGTAQTDSLEGSLHLDAGKSQTIKSTNEAFGWTAWLEGDQTKPDVGHLWLPGEDLSCDDTTVPPSATPTPKPDESRGLANTGSEGTTSVVIRINGTTITVTAPGNGKPVVTTNGETITPEVTPTATPTTTPTPSATPTATPTTTPADDTQDDEIAEQQTGQGEPDQAEALSVADEIFRLTNEFRADHGLAPYERADCLDGTADQHAERMANTGYRHMNDGEFDQVADTCPTYDGIGENIATGYEDAQEVFKAWETSTDGHREAMLDKNTTSMGVGVEMKDGKPFYVQHFGIGTNNNK